jgi:hypothetical protein
VLVDEVALDPARKRTDRRPTSGYWAFPPPLLPRATAGMMRALAAAGQRSYRRSAQRLAAARRQPLNP